MAIYDDASFIFLGSAAAGVEIKDSSKAPCVKPVEVLTGSEKVINGDFDSDSDWTKGTGWSISGGTASCSGDQTGNTGLSQLLSSDRLEDGSTYKITYTISNYVAGQVNPHLRGTATGNTTGNGTRSVYGVAGSDNSYDINFFADSSFNASIDNVSIKKVTTKAADFDISRDANLDATRVGPTGLIEKGRENLLTYSNQFDNAIWVGSSTFNIGQEGYDGTNNAWRFTKNSDSGSDYYNDLFSGLKTFSIHAKKESGKGIAIYAFYSWVDTDSDGVVDSHSGSDNCFINLETGAIVDTDGSPKHVQVDAVGNDFWRISMTVDRTNARWYLYTTVSDSLSATSITIQDAQLEVGIAATEHIPTTSAAATAGIKEHEPRFDYPLAGGAPSLLIEPERQNKFAHSEYMAGTFGTIRSTFTANAGTSPEGVQNATAVFETATGVDGGASLDPVVASSHGFQKLDIDIDDGKFYSYSFFVKANGRSKFLVQHPTAATLNTSVTVDLSGTPSVTEGRGAATGSQSIVDYGDGWYRVEINGKEGLADDADGNLNFFFHNGTQTDYLGDVTKGLLFYGFQLEEGKICTSYIPTHGAAATRSTDNVAAFDTSGFSFGTTCTIFYEGVINEVPSSFIRPITMFNSHASPQTAERFLLFAGTFSSGTYTLTSRHNTGGATAGVVKSGLTVGAKVKCASVFNGTSQKFFVNGDLAGTDTITAASVFNSLDLSQIVADQNHTVGSIMLFNSAISDADAFVLTDTSYESYSEAADSLNYIQHG